MNGMMNRKALVFFLTICLLSVSCLCQEKIIELKDVVQEFQKNNFERVIELADKAIKQGAQQPEFYFYLGSSYARLSKNSDAISSLRIFLSRADYSKSVWLLRQAFQSLISIHKNNKDIKSVMDDGNMFSEKSKESRQKEQLESFHKNVLVEALRKIGNQKASANDYAGAIEAYKKVLEYKPDDSSVINRMAVYYKNLGENDLAVEYYLKSAASWSAWSSKISPLISAVEILWETNRIEEFSKKVETDSISYNILIAAGEIKKGKYSEAFSRLKKIEDTVGSNGSISERLLRTFFTRKPGDPWFPYFFIINYPQNSASPWAIKMILNLARNNTEIEKLIKDKMLPVLEELVEKSTDPDIRRLFPRIVDMKFLGMVESREIYEEKIKLLEDFSAKYPDDPIIPEILRRQAAIYVVNLSDYRKGKEIYSLLVKKYNQKALTVQLGTCLINLEEFDEALNLLKQFIENKDTGEYAKFEAAKLLLQANFFDEGIRVLKEIDGTTKIRGLKQQISNILKDFQQYLKEDVSVDTMGRFVILNFSHKNYYFTNFVSIAENNPVLFQETESLEIVPFSNKRENITCLLQCTSRNEISLTKPYTMIFKRDGLYHASFKNRIPFSSDRWRKIEGISIIYPWQDVTTTRVKVVREYSVQDESGISKINFDGLSPDMKIEVTFSSRAGKFESVSPESTGPGPGGTMVFQPSGEKLEISIKFKPAPGLFAYYPRVRITHQTKTQSVLNTGLSEFSYEMEKIAINIIFDSQITICSILKTEETIYEIDEKIDI